MGRSPGRARRGGRADGGQLPRDLADGHARARPRRRLDRGAPRRRLRDRGARRRGRRRETGSRPSATAASTACSRRPGCCSSPSPATRASPRSARRCATRSGRSRARSRSRSAITIGLYLARRRRAARRPRAVRARGQPTAAGRSGRRGRRRPGRLPVVRVGAAVASLGALLALIAGVGRTGLAMARNGDLPGWLDSVHPRYRVPDHAELAVAAVVSVLVLTTGPARGDRLLVVRRAHVLRDRERVGVHAGRGAPPLAAHAEPGRAGRLRRPRRDAPVDRGRRRRRSVRGRPRRPAGAAQAMVSSAGSVHYRVGRRRGATMSRHPSDKRMAADRKRATADSGECIRCPGGVDHRHAGVRGAGVATGASCSPTATGCSARRSRPRTPCRRR